MKCTDCKARKAAYDRARYANAPKPWPPKRLCEPCRKRMRPAWKAWRRTYVEAHREQIVAAQRRYRVRLRKAS